MPAASYTSPFPKLELSLEEKENLYNTANALIDEAQAMYDNYWRTAKSRIDDALWETLKERESVKVFRDRRPGGGTGNKNMHLLVTTGTVPGALHDAMYGVLNHTTEAMRIKTSYVKDTLLDMAVLETIQQPTPDDPFQSMTVRWFVKGVPLHVRAISKHQDLVYLEATGMQKLRNGADVGFHLMHSIAFEKTPRLPSFERFNMSLCAIYNQASPTTVQTFMTSYFEIKESFAVPMVLRSTAEALVSVGKVIDCGLQKKLAYLVQNKSSFVSPDVNGHHKESCSVCHSTSRSARKGVKSQCSVCCRNTCSNCRVKRELSLFAPDRQLLKHTMRFCVSCMTSAKRLDAAGVAMEEALGSQSTGTHTKIQNPYTLSTSSTYSKHSDSGREPLSSVSSVSSLSFSG